MGDNDQAVDLATVMPAVRDAVNLVRAYLAEDEAESSRILAETPSHGALAANLAYMVFAAARSMSEPLLERYLSLTLKVMNDNALDVHLASTGSPDPRTSSGKHPSRAGVGAQGAS